jgi:hypothetical protein
MEWFSDRRWLSLTSRSENAADEASAEHVRLALQGAVEQPKGAETDL